jgi:hypothetical protein
VVTVVKLLYKLAFKKLGNGNGNQKQVQNHKKEFTLDDVRKKLESIGIIINIERLMAQK